MRIWDIKPEHLCRSHLLGEHRELHALWIVISKHKKGYSHHPETLRWQGKLKALYKRHEMLVEEMTRRGYVHRSPLALEEASGDEVQDVLLNTLEEQIIILRNKGCDCKI